MKKLTFYLLPFLIVLGLSACRDSDSSPRALVNMILVDSPAQWDSVFVEINGVDVEMIVEGRESDFETFFLEYKSGNKRIKISELVGGNALLLGRDELPIGRITKTTVLLGENHTMFIGSKKYVLDLAPDAENEVELETSIDIESGVAYDLLLDMDLEKSIIQNAETSYSLMPTFSLVPGIGSIELSGSLKPTTLYPAIFLRTENDTFSTHINTTGRYTFRVPMDQYEVYMDPKNEAYQDTTFTLDLSADMDSVLNEITFKPKP
ncbi:DUF4382 domain-containing protein [Algoriphagus halophytocola]|uniref:DUF4382 domain-containing protein n=1 Tax=Algoriphagus halophytocola TaxID=2991499 RepID=A0ABY6MGZ6_9BACT|nr:MULTISPECIES: DUF4382 domain-containing protein [unclassified Algoriphagus]UZD21581.1 DUF4382 domain-containing protein [Algoriphagus sp. TR-M5]WBL42794.1 DUF4382 domain-containing protein [Algoriphagus sp. TR-M9]